MVLCRLIPLIMLLMEYFLVFEQYAGVIVGLGFILALLLLFKKLVQLVIEFNDVTVAVLRRFLRVS